MSVVRTSSNVSDCMLWFGSEVLSVSCSLLVLKRFVFCCFFLNVFVHGCLGHADTRSCFARILFGIQNSFGMFSVAVDTCSHISGKFKQAAAHKTTKTPTN